MLKRNLDEAEEEIQKEKTQKRKAQREMEDMIEAQDGQTRELNSLKAKLRWEIFLLIFFKLLSQQFYFLRNCVCVCILSVTHGYGIAKIHYHKILITVIHDILENFQNLPEFFF